MCKFLTGGGTSTLSFPSLFLCLCWHCWPNFWRGLRSGTPFPLWRPFSSTSRRHGSWLRIKGASCRVKNKHVSISVLSLSDYERKFKMTQCFNHNVCVSVPMARSNEVINATSNNDKRLNLLSKPSGESMIVYYFRRRYRYDKEKTRLKDMDRSSRYVLTRERKMLRMRWQKKKSLQS